MDEINHSIKEKIERCAEIVARSVRPLGIVKSGMDPAPVGSAVLIWHRDQRYVVTAAHVADGFSAGEVVLATQSSWLSLEGAWTLTEAPAKGRDADLLDFAFAPVPADSADLFEGCDFVDASRIGEPSVVEYSGYKRAKYVALGYPLHRFKFRRAANGTETPYQTLGSVILTIAEHADLGVSHESHVACRLDDKSIVSAKGVHTAPKLVGISGGGVFRFRPLEAPGVADTPRLVGVVIEQDKQKNSILATRIEEVTRAIESAG